MSNKLGQRVLFALFVVTIVAGGAWHVAAHVLHLHGAEAPITATPVATTSPTIVYSGSSFTPIAVQIKKGDSVTFVSTGERMWVASDPHPNHDGYDGNAQSVHCARGYARPAPFDQCKAGTTFRFIFDKVGRWGYHDHINDNVGGVVDVME